MGNLEQNLFQLESAGLISLACSLPEVEYLFRHALVQDAAYASLVKSDRQALHRAAGGALERLFGDRLAELAPQLARHYFEAGDDQRALRYLPMAGEAAASAYANAEAVQHFSRAIEIAKRQVETQPASSLQQLYLRCGRALELSNRSAEATALYQDMEAWALRRGDQPLELAAILAQATLHAVGGPSYAPDRAEALIDRALALAQELEDGEGEAKVAWLRMLLRQYTGRFAEARAYGEQAVALARERNLRELLPFALDDLSRIYMGVGEIQAAQAALAEAQPLWRALDNLPMLSVSLTVSASIRLGMGEFELAIQLTEEAGRLARISGDLWGQASKGQGGNVYFEMGDPERAIQYLEEGWGFARLAGFAFGGAILLMSLAVLYASLGAYDRALDLSRQALAAASPMPPMQAGFRTVQARLLALSGQLAEADAAWKASRDIGSMFYFWWSFHWVWEAEAELALAHQDAERALAVMDHAVAEFQPRGLRLFLLDALALRGKALVAQGKLTEAKETYEEARTLAEEIGSRRALWPLLAALARIEAAKGKHAEAYELRRQARAVVEYIADHVSSVELRASFFNLPDAREVMGQGGTA